MTSCCHRLDDTAFTMIGTNLISIIGKGTDVVNGFNPFIKGIITQDGEISSGLFSFLFPLINPFRDIATDEECQ